jgi:hypothetical protein
MNLCPFNAEELFIADDLLILVESLALHVLNKNKNIKSISNLQE